MSDSFSQELFLIDSCTRGDSAIPRSIVDRNKLPIHQDPRSVNTAGGQVTSPGFVLIYVKLDLREFGADGDLAANWCKSLDIKA